MEICACEAYMLIRETVAHQQCESKNSKEICRIFRFALKLLNCKQSQTFLNIIFVYFLICKVLNAIYFTATQNPIEFMHLSNTVHKYDS